MATKEFTSLPNEEWRTVEEFPTYEVSNLGRVRRLPISKFFPTVQLRKIMFNPVTGYCELILCENYVKKMRRIHRLVAAAFLGDPDGLQINHKDGDRTNNRLDNLEIVTCSENHRHAIDVLGKDTSKQACKGEQNGGCKFRESDVLAILELYRNGMRGFEIASLFGMSRSQVYRIVNGQSWKCLQSPPKATGQI